MKNNMQKTLSAVADLPEETQEALASLWMEEVQYLSGTSLTEDQHAVVADRLSRPLNIATPSAVAALRRKFQ